MNKEPTTFGLSPERLARLLNIGTDISQAESDIDQEQKKAELLRDWLAATLPLDAVLAESLPKILGRLCQELRPLTSEPFGNLLQDSKTSIKVIRKIKDYSKELVASAKSKAEHNAAAAIYYAAIANALVFHDEKITKFSYENLKNSFSMLVGNSWLTPDLVQLFKKASNYCRKKAKRGG